jgi:hypothetical protein
MGGSPTFEGMVYNCMFDGPQEQTYSDSCQVVFLDSAEYEIPDSSTMTFEGSGSGLIMNPHSKIKFGEGSKLIIRDGARLFANNASFTSLDGSSTWDGIYLDASSNDTLKYCTIENTINGVNIIDKGSSGPAGLSTEISNCTFSNTTQTQLTSGVYINKPYSAF